MRGARVARPRRADDRFDTKGQLLDKFIELAARMPLDKITVRMLVESVGCNKTTFYYHFETVESLYEEAFERMDVEGSANAVVHEVINENRGSNSPWDNPRMVRVLDWLCTFASLNGSGRGRRYLDGLILDATSHALGVDPESSGVQERTLLAFTAGGVGEALRFRGSTGNSIPAEEFFRAVHDTVMPAINEKHRLTRKNDGSLPAWLR